MVNHRPPCVQEGIVNKSHGHSGVLGTGCSHVGTGRHHPAGQRDQRGGEGRGASPAPQPELGELLTLPCSLPSSGTPKGMDFTAVRDLLLSVEGVQALHSLHIWALTMAQPVLSVHIAIGEWVGHSGWGEDMPRGPDNLSCRRHPCIRPGPGHWYTPMGPVLFCWGGVGKDGCTTWAPDCRQRPRVSKPSLVP